MELIIVIGIIGVVVLALQQTPPRRQVIYVPVETTESHASGMSCFPLLAIGFVVVLFVLWISA